MATKRPKECSPYVLRAIFPEPAIGLDMKKAGECMYCGSTVVTASVEILLPTLTALACPLDGIIDYPKSDGSLVGRLLEIFLILMSNIHHKRYAEGFHCLSLMVKMVEDEVRKEGEK